MAIRRYTPVLSQDISGIPVAIMEQRNDGAWVLLYDVPKKEYDVEVTATIEMTVSDTINVAAIDEDDARNLAEEIARDHDWDLYSNNGLDVMSLEVGEAIEI